MFLKSKKKVLREELETNISDFLRNLNYSKMIINIHLSIIKDEYICDTFIDLKKIIKLFKNFDRNEIIFNSNFIYIKYLNLK